MTQKRRKETAEKKVIAEFEKRRRNLTRFVIIAGVFVAVVSSLAYQSGLSKMTAVALLVVSFACALIVHIKIWRCPSCNGHLGRLYLGLKLPKYCPHCGIALIEEEK